MEEKRTGADALRRLALPAAMALGGAAWVRRARDEGDDLAGQVALVTGGTRGLGFALARELLREGCRVVICARDAAELARARADLAAEGGEVLALACDVADRVQVEGMIREAIRHFGRIDILVNNAGVIQGGPAEAMVLEDFEEAMAVMYWGIVYTTQAALPGMLARGAGRIVNITSIGGKVSVPHLLPYSSAKFAAVGYSTGLRAELAGTGVSVTTIAPGLMRTGSHLNATFKGQHEKEFSLFSVLATLPGLSMDAERAARQIVRAAKRGESERVLGIPALLLARANGLFPTLLSPILGLVAMLLPGSDMGGKERLRGMEVRERLDPAQGRVVDALTTLGRRAARELNQLPGRTIEESDA